MADLLYQSIILSVVAVVLLQVLKLRVRPRARTPPGPWRLPGIGSMHHLLNVLPHRALRDLARVHGPLMMLQLGQTPLRGGVVDGRWPASYADILFSPSGSYWRKLRQLCAAEILSPSRVLSFRHIREQEVRNHVQDIHAVGPSTPVDVTAIFSGLAISIISRASFGNKQRNAREFLSAVKTGVTLASGFKIPDLFPAWRSVLARATGMRRALEDVHATIDSSLDEAIDERKRVRQGKARSGGAPVAVEENLVDVLIGLQEKGGLHRLSTNSIKGVIVDMFVAGTGTISSSLDWGMAELMRSPRVMGKLQRELREAFRGRAAIGEHDIDAASLPYLKLVIKENLRLHPPAPLLVPRESIHACELGGYVVPAGSRVVVNAWAIGRDPRYWGDDAEEFKPERFADSSVDFNGSSYEFLPFGAGRRMCPGVSYSLPFLQMALVQLCYHFNWSLPEGVAEVDMTEADGLGLRRRSPLRLCATPFVPESAC
uniref:Cytochrome P450 71D7 n=1 Tax=Aegilops tauschii TaxID=37682 RepID=M8C942_AEGTA